MKKDIHPTSGPVVFRDRDVEISSASHPFRTGSARVVGTAGRVEKSRRRYAEHTDDNDKDGN